MGLGLCIKEFSMGHINMEHTKDVKLLGEVMKIGTNLKIIGTYKVQTTKRMDKLT